MITQSEPAGGLTARYFIAQHMPDVMRKETKNIGVVVEKGDTRIARFIGQSAPGQRIDGRSIQQFADPRVYRMWVRHWESALPKEDWEERLFSANKPTFALIPGGEVTDTGADSAGKICSYLFDMLVAG